MSTEALTGRARRLTPVMRQAETVTPLELFFDLVFVLALTQCIVVETPAYGDSRHRTRERLRHERAEQ